MVQAPLARATREEATVIAMEIVAMIQEVMQTSQLSLEPLLVAVAYCYASTC